MVIGLKYFYLTKRSDLPFIVLTKVALAISLSRSPCDRLWSLTQNESSFEGLFRIFNHHRFRSNLSLAILLLVYHLFCLKRRMILLGSCLFKTLFCSTKVATNQTGGRVVVGVELFSRRWWTTGSARQSHQSNTFGMLPCMCYIIFLGVTNAQQLTTGPIQSSTKELHGVGINRVSLNWGLAKRIVGALHLVLRYFYEVVNVGLGG